MTKLNFYNGLREIGGTFVEVETERAKCMFDFGFAEADRIDKNIKLRKDCFAADYAALGVLTPAHGIYDKVTAQKLKLQAYGETVQKCFFVISHMHIDHMGGLGMLDPDIPVYMSADSLRLYRRMEANGDIQVCGHENCIGISYGDSFTVEDITVKVLAVDHDVIGACGFLITTPDGSICYTGDYRFHGFHPELSEGFAQSVKGVDVMITEGVTVSSTKVDMLALDEPTKEECAAERTEERLQQEIKAFAQSALGLLVVNPYNRNVERIHRMLHTVKEAGRTLVLEQIQADYVAEFYPEDEICVYEETIHSEIFADGRLPENWKIVNRADLLAAPQSYVLQQDYTNIYELIDLKEIISYYIHMDGAPLGDYEPSFAKLHAFLDVFHIPYVYCATGGHASPYYLRHMIDAAEPKTLIPLHSFRPEQVMSEKAGARFLPEYGDTFILQQKEKEETDENISCQ